MNQQHHARRHGRCAQTENTGIGPEGRGMGRRKQGMGCNGNGGMGCDGRGGNDPARKERRLGRGQGQGREQGQGRGQGPCAGAYADPDRRGFCVGGGSGGGGRRGRLLNHGDLRLITLALIAERPRHGYDIIKAIEDKVGGAYAPSPGVIYPTLTLLEDLGHVSVSPDNGKKLHSLTDEGRAYLDQHADTLKELEAKLGAISEQAAQKPAPEILRAMENLRTALQLRAMRGPIDTEVATHLAELIDSLAGLVEREA